MNGEYVIWCEANLEVWCVCYPFLLRIPLWGLQPNPYTCSGKILGSLFRRTDTVKCGPTKWSSMVDVVQQNGLFVWNGRVVKILINYVSVLLMFDIYLIELDYHINWSIYIWGPHWACKGASSPLLFIYPRPRLKVQVDKLKESKDDSITSNRDGAHTSINLRIVY